MLTLVWRSWQRVSPMWFAMAALLAGFQVALTIAAASIEETGDFRQLFTAVPAFVREWLGPSLMSFAGMSALTFFEPLVIILLAFFAVYVASEPAGDVESGVVDLLLARPLARHALITRSLLLMTVTVVAAVGVLAAVNVLSVALLAPPGAAGAPLRTIADLSVHLAALGWCFGGLALAAASWMSRRTSVLGALTVWVIAASLVKILVEYSDRFDMLRWLTPINYFKGTEVLVGRAPTAFDVAVLGSIGVAGVVVAYWQFNRRDV